MENTFYERFLALCRQREESPNAVARAIGVSSGSVTAWKKGAAPRMSTVQTLAAYFGVRTDDLLGSASTPLLTVPTEDQIKFALFGGSEEITDEMYEEVRNFAAFVKAREERKRKE